MNEKNLRELLERVRAGSTDVDEAVRGLKSLPYEDLSFAKIDHHRTLRKGGPEVIFCPGKETGQIAAIAEAMAAKRQNVLMTRATPEIFKAVKERLPAAEWNGPARTVTVVFEPREPKGDRVLVMTAGTGDIPVAEEAAAAAEILGSPVKRLFDVGVAGIHRLLDNRSALEEPGPIVVAAGMEGALASVVGGLTPRPVIAVPTSIGYGASFNGLAALLGMLNTCAPGVVVVNIDNGFGAGYFASIIARAAVDR